MGMFNQSEMGMTRDPSFLGFLFHIEMAFGIGTRGTTAIFYSVKFYAKHMRAHAYESAFLFL